MVQDQGDEVKWVAQRIKSLIGTTYIEYNSDGTEKNRRGLTYSDFAVLIRVFVIEMEKIRMFNLLMQ